jgi:hypothetical protein
MDAEAGSGSRSFGWQATFACLLFPGPRIVRRPYGEISKTNSVFSEEAEAVLHGMKPSAPSAKARIAAEPPDAHGAPVA